MNYFITGATGLLGSSLTRLINLNNNQVTCLVHNNKNRTIRKNVRWATGDILNLKSLINASKGADIIIHAAAAINENNPKLYYKINVSGTKNIIKAAVRNKIKLLVYISSWAINPQAGNYAKSKFLAEKEVEKFPHYLIIRPADIYSNTESHLKGLIRLIEKIPVIPIINKGDYQVSPIFVDDLVWAIFYLVNHYKENKTYTLTGPKVYSFNDLIKTILKALKKKKPAVYLPGQVIFPFIKTFDLLKITFPINVEKYQRLTTKKIIFNRFVFPKNKIKPLSFENALAQDLIKV